jgi:hypothetical protein
MAFIRIRNLRGNKDFSRFQRTRWISRQKRIANEPTEREISVAFSVILFNDDAGVINFVRFVHLRLK